MEEKASASPTQRTREQALESLWFTISGVLAALLIIAIGTAIYFWRQQQLALLAHRPAAQATVADRNFKAAKSAIDDIIANIADSVPASAARHADTVHPLLAQTESAVGQFATKAANDGDAKRSQGSMYIRFAGAYLRLGDNKRALDSARKGADIFRVLADKNPDNLLLQSDVGLSLEKVGEVLAASGDNKGAASAYRQDLDITRKLAAKEPSNPQWQTDTVLALWLLGDAGDDPKARFEEALAILRQLQSQKKLTATQESWIGMIEGAMAKLPGQHK